MYWVKVIVFFFKLARRLSDIIIFVGVIKRIWIPGGRGFPGGYRRRCRPTSVGSGVRFTFYFCVKTVRFQLLKNCLDKLWQEVGTYTYTTYYTTGIYNLIKRDLIEHEIVEL